jgi:nitroreductase
MARRRAIIELANAFSRTPDKKFLNDILNKITDPYQREVYSYSVPLQERIILTAPELLVVCFRMPKPLKECKTLFELNNLASIWLVIENILLAMAAEGLFGVTIVPFSTKEIKNILLMPEDYEIAAFIPIGYPAKEPKMRQVKIDLNNRIHFNKW